MRLLRYERVWKLFDRYSAAAPDIVSRDHPHPRTRANCFSLVKHSSRYIQTLAEWVIAGKADAMRRLVTALLIATLALVPAACRQQNEGAIKRHRHRRAAEDRRSGRRLPFDVRSGAAREYRPGARRFDANGNIVSGLAERWNVSDDGLSYIFRIAATNWPDGRKVSAEQVAKILKREIGPRTKNELKDTLGAVDDIVAMTDRVIEIRLLAPRPNLLALLAQPDLAIIQRGLGTGPFSIAGKGKEPGQLRLTRNVVASDEEEAQGGSAAWWSSRETGRRRLCGGKTDLVLGGTFADLPFARAANLPRNSLQFDPASGLFGLVPLRSDNHLGDPDARRMLSQAIDRDLIVNAFDVPGLTARATLLEPGLDQLAPPVAPAWLGAPLTDRIGGLRAQADRIYGAKKPYSVSRCRRVPVVTCCWLQSPAHGHHWVSRSSVRQILPRPISH